MIRRLKVLAANVERDERRKVGHSALLEEGEEVFVRQCVDLRSKVKELAGVNPRLALAIRGFKKRVSAG